MDPLDTLGWLSAVLLIPTLQGPGFHGDICIFARNYSIRPDSVHVIASGEVSNLTSHYCCAQATHRVLETMDILFLQMVEANNRLW